MVKYFDLIQIAQVAGEKRECQGYGAVRPRGTRRVSFLHETDLDAAAADGSATPERVVVSRCCR
jgi:hypothetical protein